MPWTSPSRQPSPLLSSAPAARSRRHRFARHLGLLLFAGSGPASAEAPAVAPAKAQAAELAQAAAYALDEYRWFHAHPELSNQEHETAARVAAALEGMGYEVQRGVGGTGLVALMKGEKPGAGPAVLYRADIDGLPVQEQTGLPYGSQKPGVMHACGHDLHVATALGALRIMAATRPLWSGTIVFVAQPAEEIGAGARQMLADAKLRQILARTGKPRVAFALHDAADLPAGQLAVSGGPTTANVDSVDITLFGRDGHGSKPHLTVDPVVMAAELTMQLQTIVSRRIAPEVSAVVTVGKIHAGSTHNVIPATAELALSVRSFDEETRQKLLGEIEHISRALADSYHAPAPPKVSQRKDYTPAGHNDDAWSARLRTRFEALLGKERVVPIPPSMGGDDFARFGRDLGIPVVYWRLGAVPPAAFAQRNSKPLPSLHSASWAPDAKAALPVGIQSVVAALHEGLSP